MPFRATAVACAVLAAAGFMLTPTAQASTRPVQVSGNKLAHALLPASQFGPDYELGLLASSGGSLLHQRAKDHVASMSCGNFEGSIGVGRFGETAAALSFSDNQNPLPSYPNTEFYFLQSVYQFGSAKAATTYYNQAHTKFAKCKDFTEPALADSVPGSGTMETVTQSVSKAAVGKYRAFEVAQSADLSDAPGISLLLNTLVTVEGTDVFTIVSVGGTNDPVPSGLMMKLINRVKRVR